MPSLPLPSFLKSPFIRERVNAFLEFVFLCLPSHPRPHLSLPTHTLYILLPLKAFTEVKLLKVQLSFPDLLQFTYHPQFPRSISVVIK